VVFFDVYLESGRHLEAFARGCVLLVSILLLFGVRFLARPCCKILTNGLFYMLIGEDVLTRLNSSKIDRRLSVSLLLLMVL